MVEGMSSVSGAGTAPRGYSALRCWPVSPRRAMDELESMLRQREDFVVVRSSRALKVEPRTGGFPIAIFMHADGFHVDFGGCQQDFDSAGQACDWVLRAVSPDYRLRIDLDGAVPYRWSLERRGEGEGEVALSCGRARMWSWQRLFPAARQVVHRAYPVPLR